MCDGSTHSTQDILISVCYSRDNDVAVYPPPQALSSSKYVSPGEINCSSAIDKLLAQGKRERLAGYRLRQAISHQVKLISRSELSLGSFIESDEQQALGLRPLTPDVNRVVSGVWVHYVPKDSEDFNEAKKCNLLQLAELPVLVVGQDQGPVGMGMSAYLQNVGACMMHFYWDPYHRLNRDMKSGLEHCPRPEKNMLQQGRLCSSYLWTLNYKPFTKGGFHSEKQSLLNMFLESHDQESDVFLEYCDLLALDFGFGAASTSEDRQRLFDSLASNLQSFRLKKSAVKSGRWFSWHDACHDHYSEFWSTRMLLSSVHGLEPSPDRMSGASPSSVELEPVEMQHWVASSWGIRAHHGKHGGASLPCTWLKCPCGSGKALLSKR